LRLLLPKGESDWEKRLVAALERVFETLSVSFLELSDTPLTYEGQAGKAVLVASDESGLVFGEGGGGSGAPVDGSNILPGTIDGGEALIPGSVTGDTIADGTIGPNNFQPGLFQIATIHDESLSNLAGAPWISTGGWRDVVGVPVIIDDWVNAFSISGIVGAYAYQKSTAKKVYVRVQFLYRWVDVFLGSTSIGLGQVTSLKFNDVAHTPYNPIDQQWAVGMRVSGVGIPVGATVVGVFADQFQLSVPATATGTDITVTAGRDQVLSGMPKLLGPRIIKTTLAQAAGYNVNLQLTPAEIIAKAGVHPFGSIVMQVLPDKKCYVYRVPYSLLGIVIRAS
jgi:hypothetical protein